MVLNIRNVFFIIIFTFSLTSCIFQHPTYEYILPKGTYNIVRVEKGEINFRMGLSIEDYTQTDRCCGSGEEDKSAYVYLSVYTPYSASNVGSSNFDFYSPSISLSIEGKTYTALSNIDAFDRFKSEYNFDEIPFERGLEGRVRASVTASNIYTGEVQSFSLSEEIVCERDFIAFFPFGP
jgi:hypothetical protein